MGEAQRRHSAALKRYTMKEDDRCRKHEEAVAAWEAECALAKSAHQEQLKLFLDNQSQHNEYISQFIEKYRSGAPEAIKGYLKEVFAKLRYPESYPVEFEIGYDAESKTATIDISLPCQDAIPNTIEYKFKKATRTGEPIPLKPRDHDDLYDSSIKQAVLHSLYAAIASTQSESVSGAVVNGWVTYLDRATGTENTSCIISVSCDRTSLDAIDLSRVDPSECIKSMRGLVAGPLAQVAPVQPILHLNRDDRRFVESQAILAELNATTNLAEIGWEEFEHLVRELFNEMFSENGAEVKVTQASSDGGVDAIAFDPDPIRGGKFVIQAKRYTNVVPVSAVRDLYGTMISEGASKGLLVTTSRFGRDSREFVKNKPISLIDGANLVFLLEKYGHKVRIDVQAARRNPERDPWAR